MADKYTFQCDEYIEPYLVVKFDKKGKIIPVKDIYDHPVLGVVDESTPQQVSVILSGIAKVKFSNYISIGDLVVPYKNGTVKSIEFFGSQKHELHSIGLVLKILNDDVVLVHLSI